MLHLLLDEASATIVKWAIQRAVLDAGQARRSRDVPVKTTSPPLHLWTLVVRHFVAKEQRIVRLPLTARLHSNRVERERRLAAPRHAREHNKLPLGNRQDHMLQVVLVSINYAYIVSIVQRLVFLMVSLSCLFAEN